MDVLVRQAHPGPAEPGYGTLAQKRDDAARYRREEAIPWPVVVDGLDGAVHHAYGRLAAASYLIDRDSRLAFVALVPHAPTLHRAIEMLLAREGRGVVLGGTDRTPHVLAPMTDGWRGLRRGLPQSVLDLMTAIPGAPALFWLGYQVRPLLEPITLRATPMPARVRAALAAAAVLGVVLWQIRTAIKRTAVSG